jgi:hypothetical protein
LSHKLCFQLVIEVAFHNYVKTFAWVQYYGEPHPFYDILQLLTTPP